MFCRPLLGFIWFWCHLAPLLLAFFFNKNIYFYFMHLSVYLKVYLYTTCMQCMQRSEEGAWFSGSELWIVASHHVSAGNENLVLCKRSQNFKLLSYFSSRSLFIWIKWCWNYSWICFLAHILDFLGIYI